MAGAHVLVGVRAELASAFLLEDSLSVLEQVAELDGMLGTSLCSWPGAAPVIRNRLQLQPGAERGTQVTCRSPASQLAQGNPGIQETKQSEQLKCA